MDGITWLGTANVANVMQEAGADCCAPAVLDYLADSEADCFLLPAGCGRREL